MKKKVLILLLILLSSPTFARVGANKDFRIISHSAYNERIQKGKDVTVIRYIVVPHVDKQFKDILETREEQALLAKFCFLLSKNKKPWIEKYLESQANQTEVQGLIAGLYYFSQKQYSNALLVLENFHMEEHDFLKYLLIADCRYELASDADNLRAGIEIYQVAMDKSSSSLEKSIINNRVKRLRYK